MAAAGCLVLRPSRPTPRRAGGKCAGGHRAVSLSHGILVVKRGGMLYGRAMFSHVVLFWTDPAKPGAADALVAGAQRYLSPAPGILHFHVGKMAASPRPVVDQSYQVGLNIVFDSKKSQDDYQSAPLHLEFVEKVFKPNCAKAIVYDFE